MDIYVLNKSFEKVGVIDDYKSIIWTTRYYSAGDFELYIRATEEMFKLLQVDYYLQRIDDEKLMIIENFNLQTDAENGDYIIVSGRSVESILSRRIVWNQTILLDTAENAIRTVIAANCIITQDTNRIISKLKLSPANGFTETIVQQVTGDNIAEWLETTCKQYGYGWKIVLENNMLVFYLFKGADRTFNNTDGNPFVVFSPKFDNLVNSNYIMNKQNYKNTALIHGEGEGAARTSASIGNSADLDRYEIYVDARDISSNEGEISAAQYKNMLIERGAQKLTENQTTAGYDGEIDADGIFKYKQDFNIGDIVQIENEYGIKATSRIIEIIENEDESGRRIVPTLEKWEIS